MKEMQKRNQLDTAEKIAIVVDDDEICRCVAVEILKNLGLRVHSATNAEEATRLVKRFNYDLVLLDFHMPSINGIDLAKILLKTDSTIKNKIFILTGEKSENVLNRVTNGETFNIIQKPLDHNEIVSFFSDEDTKNHSPEKDHKAYLCIDGIDIDSGISNFMGYESSYFNILREFPEYGMKFLSDYSNFINDKNFKECMRLAHSIKGSSLMIGATEINMLARELEKACFPPYSIQNIKHLFKKIEKEIADTSNNILDYFKSHDLT
jgi:CheY-like chemotaxis protein